MRVPSSITVFSFNPWTALLRSPLQSRWRRFWHHFGSGPCRSPRLDQSIGPERGVGTTLATCSFTDSPCPAPACRTEQHHRPWGNRTCSPPPFQTGAPEIPQKPSGGPATVLENNTWNVELSWASTGGTGHRDHLQTLMYLPTVCGGRNRGRGHYCKNLASIRNN